MSDLNHQQLSSPQSNLQPTPTRIASAATIAPTTKLSFISGTAQLETITPFVTGYHELVLVFTNAAPGLFLTTGNIFTAYQPIQNRPVTLYFDPVDAKYYVQTVA
jgi:hypothetical protein